MKQVYIFNGTIGELEAELKVSKVPHYIEQRVSARIIISFTGGDNVGLRLPKANNTRKLNQASLLDEHGHVRRGLLGPVWEPDATNEIEAVAHGNELRMTLELDDDPTRRFYKVIYERWGALKSHLENVGRLVLLDQRTAQTSAEYINESWYQQLTLEDRERYNFLRPLKEAWEINEITDDELADMAGKSIDAIRGWRRNLRNKGTPDMNWKKKNSRV